MITEQEMNRGMMTLKIIWSAIMMSLAIYAVVGSVITTNLPPPLGGEVFPTLRLALYAVGFATLIAARFVRKWILAGVNRSVDPPAERPVSLMPRYTAAVIATLAMSESVGIYGLVLFILGRDPADLYLLLGISAAAMVYYRPRKEELAGLDQGT
ncbi:MAG TPA: hypothetical protein VLQ89_09335 [Candidatus Binatia bacterium]|nr:hypothetical protein [Candidatus Binatia bacterium]